VLHLTDDAYFAHTSDGRFALSYGGVFRLDETVDAEVVDALTAALQRGLSFDEAAQQLTDEQQPEARELERILHAHGLLTPPPGTSVSDPTRSAGNEPNNKLPVLVTGDLLPVARLVAALRECGTDAHAANTGDETTVEPVTRLAIEALGRADEGSASVMQVAITDDLVCWALIDPTASPRSVVDSALRRAASRSSESARPDGPREAAFADKTFTSIAARQIAHAAGRSRPTPDSVTVLDRRTLRTTVHRATTHPYDLPAVQPGAGETGRTLATLAAGTTLAREALEEQWGCVSDSRFGAFSELEDTEFRQLPLKVVRVRTSDPSGLSPVRSAFGVGTSPASARRRAMLTALATYASNVIDPRLLVDESGKFLGPSDSDPEPLMDSVRSGDVQACVRAFDLIDHEECFLPAALAFPALGPKPPTGPACGSSASLDWQQALAQGLLQHCVQVTVSEWSQLNWHSHVLKTDEFEHDPDVRYLLAMAKAAGIEVSLRDVTGPLGVPVVACNSDAEWATFYGGGADHVDAVREALTGALFGYQLQDDPVLRAAVTDGAPSIWVSPECSGEPDPQRFVTALERLGYAPTVVVLNHDRAVAEAFPYVLRVVL
jgi:hypothetical protein